MKKIYFIFNLQFVHEGGYYFGGFLEIQINCILSKGRIIFSSHIFQLNKLIVENFLR